MVGRIILFGLAPVQCRADDIEKNIEVSHEGSSSPIRRVIH